MVKQKAQALLKAILSLKDDQESVLRYLPPLLAEQMQSMPPILGFKTDTLFSLATACHTIHFSWFAAALHSYPHEVKLAFMGALNVAHIKGIQHSMHIKEKPPTLSPFLRTYLLHILLESLQEPALIAEELLPFSSFNILLSLKKKHLLHLIGFLGIHDLAADMRQIVDRELLKRIYNALTAEQLQFLQYTSKLPIKWISPKLNLHKSEDLKKHLNHLLQYRGLIRLAKAIFQENSHFKWHLLHRLDTGRAKIIQKELYTKQDSSLMPYFKNQVLHLATRYPL